MFFPLLFSLKIWSSRLFPAYIQRVVFPLLFGCIITNPTDRDSGCFFCVFSDATVNTPTHPSVGTRTRIVCILSQVWGEPGGEGVGCRGRGDSAKLLLVVCPHNFSKIAPAQASHHENRQKLSQESAGCAGGV